MSMERYSVDWLTGKIRSHEKVKFLYFWGHTNSSGSSTGKFCLSQWFESPFRVAGVEYLTAEHWMMAQKALLFDDSEAYQKILMARTPGEAKHLGRHVSNYDQTVWDQRKYEIVKEGSLHKFSQNPVHLEFLLGTAQRVLVEASPLDSVWGVGLAQEDPRIEDVATWPGQNLLGFALMEARDNLQTGL